MPPANTDAVAFSLTVIVRIEDSSCGQYKPLLAVHFSLYTPSTNPDKVAVGLDRLEKVGTLGALTKTQSPVPDVMVLPDSVVED